MSNKDFYSRIAVLYDPLLKPLISPLRKAVSTWVVSENPNTVLDLCSGTGDQLAALPIEIQAWGIDLSQAMIHQAEKRIPGRTIQADVTSVPFPDRSFDIILSQLALHEKAPETVQRELAEVRRLLRPGGKFGVVDYTVSDRPGFWPWFFRKGISWIESRTDSDHYRHYQGWMGAGGLLEILTAAGWELLRQRSFFKGTITFAVFTPTAIERRKETK